MAEESQFNKLPNELTVSATGSEFYLVDVNTSYMKRSFNQKQEKSIVDTFGLAWTFARLTPQSIPIQIKTPNAVIELLPSMLVCMPPFSVIEWQLPVGPIEFEALSTKSFFPELNMKEPVAFKGLGRLTTSLKDITTMTSSLISQKGLSVNRSGNNCALSARIKEYLDKNYVDEISIKDLAQRFKTSPSVVTRYFRSCYGITPIRYLNRLRLSHSMFHLFASGQPVTDTAIAVGYSGVRNFRQQFTNWISASPSQFSKNLNI